MIKNGITYNKLIRNGITYSKAMFNGVQVFGSTSDADADLFILNANITDNTQKSAIQYLVSELKSSGIWSKMQAIYPYVGGTASSHKFNLKDPRDLDIAFRLTFSGMTHSLNGVQNGISDSKLNSTIVNMDSISVSFYSKSNTLENSVDFAASNDAGSRFLSHARYSDGNGYFDSFNASDNRIVVNGISDSLGLFTLTRISSNDFRIFKRGSQLALNSNNRSSNFYNTIKFGGDNNGPTTRIYAFGSIGLGLSASECVNLSTIVQQYQTILGRQV